MKFIIAAGGQGTKIWPMSREDKPKQFQSVVGEQTLYRMQIETLLQGYSADDIYISTKHKYLNFIAEQSPEISKDNLLVEPDFKKNRGPGEGYAFLRMAEIHPNEPYMIIQPDVLRMPKEAFLNMINIAEKLARKERKFITSGQKAVFPDMGSDYIQLGDKVQSEDEVEVFKISKFIDRLGDYQKTKDLVENYHVSTHTNHMCWFPELTLEAYKKYRPDWYESLMQIREHFGKADELEATNRIYSQMAEGATEEVTKHVMSEDGLLMLNPFKWVDIGTWGSIYENLAKHGQNYVDADVVNIDTHNSLIKGKKGKVIATLGVRDLVIVDTDDALLVCSRERSGDIKHILKNLEESGRTNYL